MDIVQLAVKLKKATVAHIAAIYYARGGASTLQSAKTIVGRALKDAVAMGILKEEKHKGRSVYMLPHLTGYSDHDDLIAQALVLILSRWDALIEREKLIEAVALRPDAIVLVQDANRYACLIIEVTETEHEFTIATKKNVWERWAGAKDYLSALFGVEIKAFHFTTFGKRMGGTIPLESIIQQMEAQ